MHLTALRKRKGKKIKRRYRAVKGKEWEKREGEKEKRDRQRRVRKAEEINSISNTESLNLIKDNKF